ncbi:MAG TPA: DCC1-like thiol-disulfide oxidoreductase family protein, partial [Stellaceae bacterium]|nr:DCC1-like thiol-disulfide oxidoreductase family protein [Stellaceae bacterium]
MSGRSEARGAGLPAAPRLRRIGAAEASLGATVARLVEERSEEGSAAAVDGPAEPPRPVLIYDGDCGFCFYWARYWQKLTGDRVQYRAYYQDVAAQYPAIAPAEFRRAVQFVAPDGRRASAAEASFLTLSHARGKGYWLALYRHLPGFAALSEWVYAQIAAHRPAFFRASLLLWGRNPEPPRHDLVAFLFLRLFALIYLAAFFSFAVQALGLIGSHGILPLAAMVNALAPRLGAARFVLVPMVFWVNDGDLAITAVCWAGVGLAALLAIDRLPRFSLLLLYALYLSLFYAGQVFMDFQWDTFLLETGFIALLLTIAIKPGIWLL